MLKDEEILKEIRALKEEVGRLKKEVEILRKEKTGLPYPRPSPQKRVIFVKKEIPKKLKSENLEISLGTRILPLIGMIALVLGIGFFLKYAFEHRWIGETGRVVLGLLAGSGLLFLSDFLEKKKYRLYSRIFCGGGLLVLYLSLFAAHRFYSLIPKAPAFVSFLLLTLVTAFLSLKQNSLVVAFYSLIGGFLSPFLLEPSIAPSLSDLVFVLSYVAILDIGVLILASFKKWLSLNFSGFLLTVLVFSIIYFTQLYSKPISISLLFSTFYFLIFLSASIFHNIWKKKETSVLDLLLILFNTIFYWSFGYIILKEDFPHLTGIFTIILALFYFLLAYFSFEFNPKDRYLVLSFIGLCSALFATGVAQMVHGRWITIFLSLETLVLIWLSFKLKDSRQAFDTRVLSLLFFIPAFFRLLFFDSNLHYYEKFLPIFNQRVLTFLVFIFSLLGIAFLYRKNEKYISQEEKKIVPLSYVLANFLALFLITREISDYFGALIRKAIWNYARIKSLDLQRKMWISIAWGIYALALTLFGFLKNAKPLRQLGLAIFGITVLKVFFVDLSFLTGWQRIVSFIVLGLLLLGTGFVYNKYKERIKKFI
jgi:uncharacterized membrane protein